MSTTQSPKGDEHASSDSTSLSLFSLHSSQGSGKIWSLCFPSIPEAPRAKIAFEGKFDDFDLRAAFCKRIGNLQKVALKDKSANFTRNGILREEPLQGALLEMVTTISCKTLIRNLEKTSCLSFLAELVRNTG